MKFESSEKEAVSHGDIKANNVSIDTNNINFIVTILSTNLYSKPIESFIRETVSNAWDSHVEAGTTEPVILELGKDTEGNYFCRIQDFGVGLSPERFNNIYRNIGSSTKRDTNGQIGGFGIGRFSALAYSDVVHITSNFDGKKYRYMMYKDGNSISIDLLHEQETDERNGVEVQLPLKNINDITNFYSAIKRQLVYFENLYFVDSTDTYYIPKDEFNNFKIKRYRDFLVNDLESERSVDLVLGKVRYPLRLSSLNKNYPAYVEDYPISLIFQIGDLEVTPNREELLYSERSIAKIESALDLAIEEIKEIFADYSTKDYTKVSEYYQALQHAHEAPLMTNEDGVNTVYIKINSKELKITLNGHKFEKKSFVGIHNQIMSLSLIPTAYQITYGGKLNYITGNINLNNIKQNFSNTYVADLSNINNMTKNYVRDTFDVETKFIHTKRPLRHFVRAYMNSIITYTKQGYNNVPYDALATKIILKSVIPNILKIQKFDESKVPQTYIDRKKAEEKYKRSLRKNAGVDWSEHVNINVLGASARGYNQVIGTSTTYSLTDIKKTFQKLTVYDNKDTETIKALYNISYNNNEAYYIQVAETRQKLLKNFDNFVKLEDFMSVEYKLIRQIGTAQLIKETIPYIDKLYLIHNSVGQISVKLQELIKELYQYQKKYISDKSGDTEKKLTQEIYQLCKDKNYFDENMRGTLNANLSMLKNAEALLLFSEGSMIPNTRINLAVDYILARKLFRPDVKAVIKSKKETILNIKIKEDEHNQS